MIVRTQKDRPLRRALLILLALAQLSWAGSLAAADKTPGTIKGKLVLADGDALQGAYVYLSGPGLKATPATTPPVIRQNGKQFDPRVLAIVKGTPIQFPNDDRIMHNVFSRSAGNSFDLGYYKSGDSKTVLFKEPGVVDVYCNIHPHMVSTILVLDNDFFARVNDDGTFEINNIPPGQYEIVGWMPNAEAPAAKVVVKSGAATALEIKMPKADGGAAHLNKEGMPYGRYK